jgi:UDP:flavonoid glycosyltransferase YjiC (YdhE family)
VLDPLVATPAEIGAAVRTVLEQPAYRDAAERVRREVLALPDAVHAVTLLERLSAESGAGG